MAIIELNNTASLKIVKSGMSKPSFSEQAMEDLKDVSKPITHQVEALLASASAPMTAAQISDALYKPDAVCWWRHQMLVNLRLQARRGVLVKDAATGPLNKNGSKVVVFSLKNKPFEQNGVHIPHFIVRQSIHAAAAEAQREEGKQSQRKAAVTRLLRAKNPNDLRVPMLNHWAQVGVSHTGMAEVVDAAIHRVGAAEWLIDDMRSACMLHILEGGGAEVEVLIAVVKQAKRDYYRHSVMGMGALSLDKPFGGDPDGRTLLDTLDESGQR